jgi:hypothetical protein
MMPVNVQPAPAVEKEQAFAIGTSIYFFDDSESVICSY